MDTLKMSPFVKWAGGKSQLLARLRERVPDFGGTYFEPFVGSGALFLALRPCRAVLNDVNAQLLNVYSQLRQDAEAVIAAVNALDAPLCAPARYRELRAAYNRKILARELDVDCAALLIWLNKHCFNGLYRVNAKGLFNVPYNNKTGIRSMDAHNLRAIGAYLRGADIIIRHGDFEAACAKVRAGDFVYFDSPYVPASPSANFTDYARGGFDLAAHRRLAALFRRLDARGARLMSSNHDVELVRALYAGYRIELVAVRRSINRDGTKRTGREVIITNWL